MTNKIEEKNNKIKNKKMQRKNRLKKQNKKKRDSKGSRGSFSETTTASFAVEAVLGAVTGDEIDESVSLDYQMGIGLETSFTGEDSLSATIDIGGTGEAGSVLASPSVMNYNATSDALILDGLTYTFPVGGATVIVGDNTDISALYTGACAYNSFTDYMGNCGTGNSVGIGGAGVTAAMSYAFDTGLSVAGGISSDPTKIFTEQSADAFGLELAYKADTYGVAVAYSDVDGFDDEGTKTQTNYWGINAKFELPWLNNAHLTIGLEIQDDDDADKTATGYFVGLCVPIQGDSSFDLAMGTTANYSSDEEQYWQYEVSYTFNVNDYMTITPGIAVADTAVGNYTATAVKASLYY